MKKINLLAIVLILSVQLFSQSAPTEADFLLKRSKSQKTGAWLLLGGGIASITAGALIGPAEVSDYNNIWDPFDDEHDGIGGTGFIVGGTLAVLGSIPLFMAAARNKKDAVLISLKEEKTQVIYHGSFADRSYPAISLRIKLNN